MTHLNSFIDAHVNHILEADDIISMRGHLKCLSEIYKYGARDILQPTLRRALDSLKIVDSPILQKNSLLRKLLIKLCQRIGLCFMRVRTANWRYSRCNKFF